MQAPTVFHFPDGTTIKLEDWIDDKTYDTISFVQSPWPGFGHFPGESQSARRWPDIFRRWFGRRPRSDRRLHNRRRSGTDDAERRLERYRDGKLFFVEGDTQDLARLLKLTDKATAIVAHLITETDFMSADSEWALVNLIDAAVDVASKP